MQMAQHIGSLFCGHGLILITDILAEVTVVSV